MMQNDDVRDERKKLISKTAQEIILIVCASFSTKAQM